MSRQIFSFYGEELEIVSVITKHKQLWLFVGSFLKIVNLKDGVELNVSPENLRDCQKLARRRESVANS